MVKLIKEKLKIIVFKFLCFFVARDGIADVAEVSISKNRAASRTNLLKLENIGTFGVCFNIKFFNHIAFQRAENVIFVKFGMISAGKYLPANLL